MFIDFERKLIILHLSNVDIYVDLLQYFVHFLFFFNKKIRINEMYQTVYQMIKM